MSTSTPRRRASARRALTTRIAVLATAAAGLGGLATTPAVAGPGGATGPACSVGAGSIGITSATAVAKGQRLSFAGSGFAGNTGGFQRLSLKIDAEGPGLPGYLGDGAGNPLSEKIFGPFQVQGDGTVSGSIVVPADLDNAAVNSNGWEGPHFARFLGSAPAASCWTGDFTLDAAATPAPAVTATAVTSSGRGGSNVTVTVTGTGFAAGESVGVARATGATTRTDLAWTVGTGAGATTPATIAADGTGALSGKLVLPLGKLTAGEHQLLFTGATSEASAQVDVKGIVAVSGLAQASNGTLTVQNVPVGTTISSVKIDNAPDAAGGEVEVLGAPVVVNGTADANGNIVTTGVVSVPATQPTGFGKTVVVTQSQPYPATYTLTSKVSPSSALLDVDGYARVESAAGAVAEGLYQTAYSAKNDVVFATTAQVSYPSRLYKLDADTLAVLDSVEPAKVTPTDPAENAARFAVYGVGVDDVNGTVWITNTRQNTVAVYDQSTLELLVQHPSGTVTHSRDVVYDPRTNRVFVSSASEGSSGDGYISVFEGGDNDGDGTRFEKIQDAALHPRTEFSPMSLELDEEDGKVYTTSLSTSKALALDTTTLEDEVIDLDVPDLANRGFSGVGVDPAGDRLFAVAQDNDLLLITDLQGNTIREVPIGAGALNVAVDRVNKLLYIANFGGTTVSVADYDGNLVANLPFTRPNHVHEDGSGSVYAVNKDSGNKVIKLTPKVASATPTITGRAVVAQPLTAVSGAWTSGATLSYAWNRDGAAIAGATAASYTPTAADAGRALTVTVTGALAGRATTSATSAATTVARGTLTAAKPKIRGKAVVGRKLAVRTSGWTAGTKLSYRWLANGKAIRGGTGKALKLTKALKGKRITVRVAGTKAGFTAKVVTSARTKAVKKR
ncbi:hypothetical protein [Nocardioides sp. W7]|uniref:hypothetical protein n=1 Tax=Nocardioides sp. W7 TaxID=2931390 RepID=UPI001FD48D91|nr:hypothetical protein [Nocardioides sp. W7]